MRPLPVSVFTGQPVEQDGSAAVKPAGASGCDRGRAGDVAIVVREIEREAPRLTRHSPAGQVLPGYLRDQVAAIWRHDPLVRRDAPDAVHQMRVATRRARGALQASGGIIVARTMLLELAGKARAAGEDTFTYGLVHQRQACQAATTEQALPRFVAAPRDRPRGH